jgi:hypothetical protein
MGYNPAFSIFSLIQLPGQAVCLIARAIGHQFSQNRSGYFP